METETTPGWVSLMRLMRVRALDHRALAAALEVGETTVQGWLAGRSNPSAATLARLAGTLGEAQAVLPELLADMPNPADYQPRPSRLAWPSLRAAMDKAGRDKEELGAQLGVGWWTVQNWLYGETIPRTGTIRQLAQALAPEGEEEDLLATLLRDMPTVSRRQRRASFFASDETKSAISAPEVVEP